MTSLRALAATASAGVAALLVGEWADARWSRQLVHDVPARTEAVVVLGFANRGRRINAVNRWRVRVALRSLDPDAASTLICSGGAVASAVSEAELLAGHARSLGFEGPLVVESDSRSTWENVRNCIPLIEDADRIVFASNAGHAARARRYLAQQRPDLAPRLAGADDHRFGETSWLKAAVVLHALVVAVLPAEWVRRGRLGSR